MPVYRVPVNITWSGPGSPGANIWHFSVDDVTNTPAQNLQEAVNSLHAFYTGLTALGQFSQNLYGGNTALSLGQVVDVETKKVMDTPTWTTITGSGGAVLPPSLQVCVSWSSDLAARRGRGRTFLGPLGGQVRADDGTLQDDFLTGIRAKATSFLTDSKSANGWAVGVWAQRDAMPGKAITSKQRAAAPHIFREFLTASVKDQFAILRSRRD